MLLTVETLNSAALSTHKPSRVLPVALLVYRAAPSSSTGVGPAELLMGQKLRSTLPALSENVDPGLKRRK